MRQLIKKIISYITYRFGYRFVSKKLVEHSDDPFIVIAGLLSNIGVQTVVDGGASIGDITIKLSKLFKDAQIYAFEPYLPFVKIFKDKTKDFSNIHLEPFALDETEGTKRLNINNSEGTNSILNANLSENQPFGSLMEKSDEVDISCKTLEKWSKNNKIPAIDLIKLDLQGNELAALKGAFSLFNHNSVKCILCEVSFIAQYEKQPLASEVINFLTAHRFDLFNFYQIHFHHGQIIQADALFIHKSISQDVLQASKHLLHPHSQYLKLS